MTFVNFHCVPYNFFIPTHFNSCVHFECSHYYGIFLFHRNRQRQVEGLRRSVPPGSGSDGERKADDEELPARHLQDEGQLHDEEPGIRVHSVHPGNSGEPQSTGEYYRACIQYIRETGSNHKVLMSTSDSQQ